jgi:hypothetical protein
MADFQRKHAHRLLRLADLTPQEGDYLFLPIQCNPLGSGVGPFSDASGKKVAEHIRKFTDEKCRSVGIKTSWKWLR